MRLSNLVDLKLHSKYELCVMTPIADADSAGASMKKDMNGCKADLGRIRPLIWAVVLLAFSACHRQIGVRQPHAPAGPDPKALEYLAKGDEYFRRNHLYGWRMAEDLYSKAYALAPTAETGNKLLFARVLRFTREIDEDIAVSELEKRLAADCASPADPRQQWLCEFSRRYSAPLPAVKADSPEAHIGDWPEFGPDEADLRVYVYILDAQARGLALPKDYQNAASEQFKGSLLFVYLNLRKMSDQARQELEQAQPDFAELSVLNGETHSQRRRFREARASFNKALELVPDYTRAITGLGNIYLYVLEDYEDALKQYESTLRWDATNTGGLFGKGAVLHSLGRFSDSNPAFDIMLASDLTRRGRTDRSTTRFYEGMGRYYQAYNFYEMFDPEQARKMIDLAKKALPETEQVLYFSGLLYFNANQMEPARIDFQAALSHGASNCDANYYLGLINLQSDESKAASYFLGMCSCMESAISALKNDIAGVPKLDLEQNERDSLKAKLQQKLSGYHKTGGDQIRSAIKMMDLTSLGRKNLYIQLMNETLQRVTETESNP